MQNGECEMKTKYKRLQWLKNSILESKKSCHWYECILNINRSQECVKGKRVGGRQTFGYLGRSHAGNVALSTDNKYLLFSYGGRRLTPRFDMLD